MKDLKEYDFDGYSLVQKVWGFSATDNLDNVPFCWDILENPKKQVSGYRKFNKYIRVLDSFDIYAEEGVSGDVLKYVASVAAELLDNDENGICDDLQVCRKLSFLEGRDFIKITFEVILT